MDEQSQSISELEQLAESGDTHAQYLMGKLWRDGPALIPDSVNARYWFERAAQQRNAAAQYSLAKLLLSADIEVQDIPEGLRWLETAAENGSHHAAYRLGKEYLKGQIVEKDPDKAVKYLTQSAEAGNQFAQYALGKLYLDKHDQEQAHYWFTQSTAQGNEYAQFFLDRWDNLKLPSVMLSVTRLLHHMSEIFRDNSVPPQAPVGQEVDQKLWLKTREKKIAMGHKADDHEEQFQNRTMAMG